MPKVTDNTVLLLDNPKFLGKTAARIVSLIHWSYRNLVFWPLLILALMKQEKLENFSLRGLLSRWKSPQPCQGEPTYITQPANSKRSIFHRQAIVVQQMIDGLALSLQLHNWTRGLAVFRKPLQFEYVSPASHSCLRQLATLPIDQEGLYRSIIHVQLFEMLNCAQFYLLQIRNRSARIHQLVNPIIFLLPFATLLKKSSVWNPLFNYLILDFCFHIISSLKERSINSRKYLVSCRCIPLDDLTIHLWGPLHGSH